MNVPNSRVARTPSSVIPPAAAESLRDRAKRYRNSLETAAKEREAFFATVRWAANYRGWPQAEIAREIGLTRAEVNRILKVGKR